MSIASKYLVFSLSVVVVLFASQGSRVANADNIFVFDNSVASLTDGLSNGDSVTVDGITITFSNVVVSDGSGAGDVEADGILISGSTNPSFSDVTSFDFSFDTDVFLNAYTIGLHEDVPAGRSLTVIGGGGVSGNNAIPVGTSFTEQTFAFDSGTISFFESGQVYSFSHDLPEAGDPLFNLKGFTVSAVPEPGAISILGFGCLA